MKMDDGLTKTLPSVKMLVVGDLHFKAQNLDILETLRKELMGIIINNEVSYLVFTGDIFDQHAYIHSPSMKAATDFILDLTKMVECCFVIVGNHDYINNSQNCTANHALYPFKRMRSNLKVFDKPSSLPSNCCVGGNKLLFVPYVPTGKFIETVSSEEYNSADIIFAHQEFKGAIYHGSVASTDGDEWPRNAPLVISGHIHDKSWLQENIYYVGTPFQQKFDEAASKSVLMIHFFDGKYGLEEIELKTLPKKRSVEILPEQIESVTVLPNEFLRVKVSCNAIQWASLKKTKKFKELVAEGVKIVPVATSETSDKKSTKGRSYMEIMMEFVNASSQRIQRVFSEIINDKNGEK